MNNQAKIAELKKNINNKFFPEALKPKLLAQIEKLEAEDKASTKTTNVRSLIKYNNKFNVGDIVTLKGENNLTKEITSFKLNRNKEFVYDAKYVSKPNEQGSWLESELQLFESAKNKGILPHPKPKQSKTIDYNQMSDEDFAFTTLGKIVDADGKAWNETKADSGSEIRNSEKLTKLYATSLQKSLKDLKVKKNSLTEKEYDYLVDNNYHLLNEFLFWNDFYENDFAKSQKEMYQRLFADKSNHSSAANPEWITISKGILPHPKPKKPTVARNVKKVTKKYYAHREIKTVTVIENGKKVVYKGEDVLNGAQFLAKGGKVVENIATYYPIRSIVEVTLDNGEKVKPSNGYHIKNGAKPIAELGAALATEEIINNSIVDYHNPRFAYAEGGEVSTSGSGDFDYIKFLDFVQPKVAATLLENNVTLLNDYTIVHEGKEYEPVIIYKGIDGKANALSVGYFADNDPQLKLLLSIDFELDEMEYHIRSKGWNINDVDMYAKGGWVKDHKYLNKAEAYEMRYAKGKNRKGYMAEGGKVSTFDYKNEKYQKDKIISIKDVEKFFYYLVYVENLSFHPDDEFEGNMYDSLTKKQAITLDRYMLDCFDVCKENKVDIYGIAANPMLLKANEVVGRKAKGVSVKQIANMHNVTEKYLRKQLARGQKVELEHTTDEAVAYAIAKDHIYENPDYYILLEKIEMKANGGEVKNYAEFSITVPKAKVYLLEEKNHYDLISFIEKELTKKWFGSGSFSITDFKVVSPTIATLKIKVPRNREYLLTDEYDYELTSFISSKLTKKWFGTGSFDVRTIEKKAKGGKVKTSKFKLNDILVPEKDGDYSEDFWKVTALDLSNNSMTISKLKNGKFSEDFTSSPTNAEKGFRLANEEELDELKRVLDNWSDASEYAKGGLIDWKSSANNGKKVRGIYEIDSPNFKGNIQIVGFEQVDDIYYSLYQPLSDERIGPKEIHSINVQSNKINNLDKGLTVVALDKNKQKVKIKRVANLGTSGYFEKGGEVDKGILPHPKPKRQGSQIFAKAAEIREPGEKWQDAVKRANLLLKK